MTGGLAYLLCSDAGDGTTDDHKSDVRANDRANDDQRNRDSVRLAALEPREEVWLRRILHRHVQLTGSPRAAKLLSCSTLPLLRVEPLTPPCSIEETWASILARLAAHEARTYGRDKPLSSERPVVQ
jgi:hypothetical protein